LFIQSSGKEKKKEGGRITKAITYMIYASQSKI
jgi:hypothetical protein